MDISSNAGGAGSFSFDDSSSPALPSTGRGRVRSADFGLPERTGLMDLARNTIESLRLGELAGETGVRVIGASDGFDSANPQSSLLLPVLGSMNEAFITQLRSKVKRGMDDAFRRGDNIQPPGVGYRLVDVKDAGGNLVITHKRTIEKRAEIDPEAAAWIVRGAEMIAREGNSPIEVARLFNEQKVGGRQTWSDNMIRKLYSRERLVGREVFRTT
jgi:DNA invertase Pin-like site-specific DNA recombinase